MSPRSTNIRTALIRAATQLVSEVGYHQATTKLIAERAGVAEGSIYRHFPDKRALFTAAILVGQHHITAWMADLPSRAGTQTVVDILTETFAQLSTLRAAVIPLERALAAEPELRRHVSATALPDVVIGLGGPPQLLAEYLRAEQQVHRVRIELEPAYIAVVLLSALFGMQTSPLSEPDGLDRSAFRNLAALLVNGIT